MHGSGLERCSEHHLVVVSLLEGMGFGRCWRPWFGWRDGTRRVEKRFYLGWSDIGQVGIDSIEDRMAMVRESNEGLQLRQLN